MSDVVDNARLSRFELTEDGLTAFATYRRHGDRFTIPHVEAPLPLRGKGTAGRLMAGVAALARAQNYKLLPTCPYAIAWFRRHPDATDLLER